MSGTVAAWLFPAWFVTIILAMTLGGWVAWPMGHDRGFEEGLGDRHRHRHGDPTVTTLLRLPLSNCLAVEPDPDDWRFAGGWDEGAVAGPAEYELLTRAAEVSTVDTSETDSGFTRRMAREVTEMIAKWNAETNYLCHTMRAD